MNIYEFDDIVYPAYIQNGQCIVEISWTKHSWSQKEYIKLKKDQYSIINTFKKDIKKKESKRNTVTVEWKNSYLDINEVKPCEILKKFIGKYRLKQYYSRSDEL